MEYIIMMITPAVIAFFLGIIAGILIPNFKRYIQLKKKISSNIDIEARFSDGKTKKIHINKNMNQHEIDAIFKQIIKET